MKIYLKDRAVKSSNGIHPERGASFRWGSTVVYYDEKYENCIMELEIMSENELNELGLAYVDIEDEIKAFIEGREISKEEYDLLRGYYTK